MIYLFLFLSFNTLTPHAEWKEKKETGNVALPIIDTWTLVTQTRFSKIDKVCSFLVDSEKTLYIPSLSYE